jgi:hypothetical protein
MFSYKMRKTGECCIALTTIDGLIYFLWEETVVILDNYLRHMP